MPIHSYWCDNCKTRKGRKSSFEDLVDRIACPNCGQWMKKELHVPAVIYKGQGFSKTNVKKPYDPFDKDDLDKGMEKTNK